MTATKSTLKDQLGRTLDRLTPEQQREVLDFAAFLEAGRSSRHSATRRDEASEASAAEPKGATDDWKRAWRQACGMWKDRDDLPEFFEELRRDWDKRIPEERP